MESIVRTHLPEQVDEFKYRWKVFDDLSHKKFSSPEALQSHFGDLFTPEQASNIWNNLQRKGGANDEVDYLSPTVSSAIEKLLAIFIPEVRIPIKTGLSFVFILSYLEKLPMFGPLVAAAMDVTAAVLPTIAVNLQNLTPPLIGLLPIPYASFAGIVVGWMFSAFFLWMAILLGISRQQFGPAIEAMSGLIPVVGPTVMNWVAKANLTAAKLEMRRKQVAESFANLMQQISSVLDSTVTPTLNKLNAEVQKQAAPMPGARRKKLTKSRKSKEQWQRTRRSKMRFGSGSRSTTARANSRRS